jgi:hypothetical protein
MALPLVVAGIVAAVAVAPEVIEGVENAFDKAFKRSIIFEVTNATAEPLHVEMDGDGHSGGGFGTAPPHVIAPFSAAVFSSRGHGDVRGSLRLVGDKVWFGMSFSNPWLGDNTLRSSVNWPRAPEFKVHAIAGQGNTNARFVYVAYDSDTNRVEKAYEAHRRSQASSPVPRVTGKPIQAMGKKRTAKKTPTAAELTERAMKVTDTGRLRNPR